MAFDTDILEFHKVLEKIEAYCQTELGRETVRAMKPTSNETEIRAMLDETEEAFWVVHEGIQPVFNDVRNLRGALKRVRVGGVLSIRDFLDIKTHTAATRRIKRETARFSERLEKPVGIEHYAEALILCPQLETAIKETIDEHGDVQSGASTELKTIRNALHTTERRIRQTLDAVLKKEAKKLAENIVTMRHDRYVVPVRLSDKNTFPGTILDYSSSGETAYVEPEAVREATAKKMQLEANETREIERILAQLSVMVASHADALQQNTEVLIHLECLFAKATYAHGIDAVKPIVAGAFNLIKARHPLIPSEEVVANTIAFDEGIRMMVITGSNTGGKTVTLKTAGLLSVMAQSGCMIPARAGSSLPIFHQIRADIGDEQSIEQSLSTFSSHMKNIVDIIRKIEKNSLVLLDEIGVGTDPNEGASLAMSILDALDEKGAIVMATTHYPELKAYAYSKESIVNASVEFDEKSLQPTYRLLIRTPGESHAFLIGERLGLPASIVANARERLVTADTDISDMIRNLKDEGQRLDKMTKEYEQLLETNQTLNEDISKLKKELVEERASLKETLTIENRERVEKLKRQALALIDELEAMKDASFKEHDIAELKHKVRSLAVEGEETSKTPKHDYRPRDTVYIMKYNRHGELLKHQKDDRWLVKMGTLKSVFATKDFEYVGQRETVLKKPTQRSSIQERPKPVAGSLDLRGFRVHEAREALEKYLDDCLLAGTPFVSVIHGYGTLALRKMVHETLLAHSGVKSFRDGEAGEGGSGVSVVHFK